jgi:MFS family permease
MLLFAAMTIGYIDRGNMAVAAPVLEREFGLSKSAVGMVLSVFFWAYALVQLPAGWLIDRLDLKKVYAWAFAGWCLVTIATGFVNSIAALICMRALLAVGESVSTPASHRSIRYLFGPDERGLPTGVYSSGTKLGPAIGTPLAALLLLHFGWQGLFWITGAAGLLWLWPWLKFYRSPPAEQTHKQPPGEPAGGWREVVAAFRLRAVWGIFLGFFCYGYIWHVYATWLPGYLVAERKMSLLQMGFWGALPFVAFAATIPVAGFISDRLLADGREPTRTRKTFIGVGLAMGSLIVPAAYVDSAQTAVWLLTASAGGIGLSTANIWVITQTIAPASRVGTWVGIQNLGGVIGAALAPMLTGLLADRTGSFVAPLSLAGALSCLGILCYVYLIPDLVRPIDTP